MDLTIYMELRRKKNSWWGIRPSRHRQVSCGPLSFLTDNSQGIMTFFSTHMGYRCASEWRTVACAGIGPLHLPSPDGRRLAGAACPCTASRLMNRM